MDIFTYYIHIFIHNSCFFVVLIFTNHPFLNADCRFLILSIDHKTNTVLRIIYFNRNYLWTLYRIISKKETMTFPYCLLQVAHVLVGSRRVVATLRCFQPQLHRGQMPKHSARLKGVIWPLLTLSLLLIK